MLHGESDSCPVLQFSSHFGAGDPNYLGPCSQHQLTWSPSTLGATSTVRELEGLYNTLRQQQQQQQRAGKPRRSSVSNGGLSFGAGLPSYPSWRLGEFLPSARYPRVRPRFRVLMLVCLPVQGVATATAAR